MARKKLGVSEKDPKDYAIMLKLQRPLKDALQRMADDDNRTLASTIRLILIAHIDGGKR